MENLQQHRTKVFVFGNGSSGLGEMCQRCRSGRATGRLQIENGRPNTSSK